jgi:lysozyme family protein
MNSTWKGWADIDNAKNKPGFPGSLERNAKLQNMIHDFYMINYWDRIDGNDIINEKVALAIFDFAVNAGVKPSASLAQKVIGVKIDGAIGPITIKALNKFNPDHFIAAFTVLKIEKYVSFVKNKPDNIKFFFGWICRALNF